MSQIWSTFRDCGFIAWLILLAGALGLAVGGVAVILALVAKGKVGLYAGLGSIVIAVGCLGLGAAGMFTGQSRTDGAISGESIDPSMKERIREEGYRESRQCVSVGGVNAAVPLLAGVVAVIIAMSRRRST
jgi:hypothetical protein